MGINVRTEYFRIIEDDESSFFTLYVGGVSNSVEVCVIYMLKNVP